MRFSVNTHRRRTMFLAMMAVPMAIGAAAHADEAGETSAARDLAEQARLLHQLLALQHAASGFWHQQTHVLLDAATACSSVGQTASFGALQAAMTGLREAKEAADDQINTTSGLVPLRRLQLKNVSGTVQHLADDTAGILEYLTQAEVARAVAVHRERSVPLFEILQSNFDVVTKALGADIDKLAASL
jgi:hypothetical protein